jgi:hypothetical protein
MGGFLDRMHTLAMIRLKHTHQEIPLTMIRRLVQAVTLCILVGLTTQSSAVDDVSARLKGALEALPRDAHAIINNSHYVVSNEFDHHRLGPYVEAKGGVFMGIGTDQNYMLIPWSKPRYVIMLDIDQVISNVHHVYRVAFTVSRTPNSFMLFFGRGRMARSLRAIRAQVPAGRQRKVLTDTLRRFGGRIYRRLKRVRARLNMVGVKAYLNDQTHYDYLATLCREGRFFAVRGDLTGTRTIKNISAILRGLGLTVGSFFFSNAERYFKYTPAFKANMQSLPFAPNSQIIRTSKYPRRRTYQYYFQTAGNFRKWLSLPSLVRVKQLVRMGKKTKTRLVYRLPQSP